MFFEEELKVACMFKKDQILSEGLLSYLQSKKIKPEKQNQNQKLQNFEA